MSELIVLLPTSPSSVAPVYRYVATRDGQTATAHGSATATTLPPGSAGQDVVAIVPVHALSWHQVALPKGTLAAGVQRLRAVLDGLLEDRILDDPQSLHLAIAPHPTAGAPLWVAACDKTWLQTALAPLEAAGRPVSRIVPEFTPTAPDAIANSLHALGEPGAAWLVQADTQGVTVLPLQASVVAHAISRGETLGASKTTETAGALNAVDAQGSAPLVLAEPGVAALANQLFHDRVTLQQAPERWVNAVQSSWDLAQFDLANSGRQRAYKKFSSLWLDLLHAPRWRAARVGAVLVIAANVLGLNAWAWKEKAALQQQRKAVDAVLTQTFPQVKVVVDAPVQMARELTKLQQAAGAASGRDLENLLTAVGSTLAPTENMNLTQLDYAEGELRIKGGGAQEAKAQDMVSRLGAQGYAVRMDGDSLVVQQQAQARP